MLDLSETLFRVKADKIIPECGNLLVSNPFMRDKYFRHSVVALIDYVPSEGATGVVMNSPAGYPLEDVLPEVGSDSGVEVYCGGPLGQDRLYFMHTLGEDIIPGARLFAPGLYVGGSFDAMIAYLRAGYPAEGFVRFFVGYSSWTCGQLEGEISDGTWALGVRANASANILRNSGDSYWHHAVRRLGEPFRPWNLIPRYAIYN